jgi:alpha-1,4-digalacturonate transport system permease protein
MLFVPLRRNNTLGPGSGTLSLPGLQRNLKAKARIPLAPYVFIAPAIIIFSLFIVWPAFQGFFQSLFQRGILVRQDVPVLRSRFIGLKNFGMLFSDHRFLVAFGKTLLFSVITVPLTMASSLMLALLLKSKFRGVGLARSFIYWPSMISPIIIGIAWKWILGYDTGILNYLASLVGIGKVPWLLEDTHAFLSVVMVSVWAQTGFYMVIYIGGLNNIPDSYYEAAEMDGAGPWRKFTDITLPLLKPTTLLVLVLSTINAFKVYQQVTVLTAGGPGRATLFLVQNIYEEAFTKPSGVGYASAQSVVFFLVMLILSVAQFKLSKEE